MGETAESIQSGRKPSFGFRRISRQLISRLHTLLLGLTQC
jgi:hypothetical protein